MVDNINVNRFRNGDSIPEVKGDKWYREKAAWCYYNNDSEIGENYGKLYNWYTVNDPRGLAPQGWHIATDEEFKTLIKVVKNSSNALKAIGQGTSNGIGSNSSGFSALLGGYRGLDNCFFYMKEFAYFWSSTEVSSTYARYLYLNLNNNNICLADYGKEFGFSVRCIKD